MSRREARDFVLLLRFSGDTNVYLSIERSHFEDSKLYLYTTQTSISPPLSTLTSLMIMASSLT